eukprot:TRINITY_DN4645_c0_g1_i1.p1 TRINITY_DN4645_c0_g1~~TRINITY_DN4645_c0_g1_i1.p1  ORF type:complete len:212 (-),score=33.82 TRINITY_DN4645_c0_g1_i1:10-645(-)
MILTLLAYLTYAFGFCFSTICLACGLYYVAEIAEEHTAIARRIIRYMIMTIIGLHCLLLFFEDLPLTHVAFGLISHCTYYLLLKDFPFIEFSDPKFIGSVVCMIADHSMWFYYFMYHFHDFTDVASFFIIMVWMIPFAYFLSLSANESSLPYGIISSSGEEVSADDFTYPMGSRKRGKRTSPFMSLFGWFKKKRDTVLPSFNTSTRNQKLY